ncbi:MAG: hypothetical protein ABFE13_09975 [Phycisphaerales bacterium]
MKRISPWLVLLALTPGIADATYYVPPRYRVHYSPYSLSYRSSGLVRGGLDYSTQAFNYRHSGLVSEGVRYTPYRLRYGGTGLVIDYYGYSTPSGYSGPVCEERPIHVPARPPRVCAASNSSGHPGPREPDGIQTIRQCLQAKGHTAVNMNRIMRIDNALVSVEFFLKDQNLIIKYWNSDEIESLSTKEAFNQKAYERYRQNWTQTAARHEQNGGRVLCVEASGAQAIVAALDSCKELNAAPEERSEPVMYARD